MATDTTQVMIDLETLGKSIGSAIVSFGAVTFTIDDGIEHRFYQEIDRESCTELGLGVEEETLEWWDEQDDDVKSVLEGGRDLEETLENFNSWYPFKYANVWANSPSFDCNMLKAAYSAVGMDVPWMYFKERDARTIKNLPCAVELEQEGDKHNALNDAEHQARVVRQTLKRINEFEDQ